MERNANYALVGLITVLLVAGLASFAVWLGEFSLQRSIDQYRIVFQGPVNGISEGAEVHFNGIKVGEVTGIALCTGDATRVCADIDIDAKIPVKVDSIATLEPQGITGVNFVQISAGTAEAELLMNEENRDERPVIRSARGALSDLLAGGGAVLVRVSEALDRVNRVLSDENIRSFGVTMTSIGSVAAELDAREDLVADAQGALRNAQQAAREIGTLAASSRSLIDNEGRVALASLAKAADSIDQSARELRAVMTRLEGPTGDFATSGLPQIQAAVASLQQTTETLNRVAEEVEQNPRGLIARPPAQEIEVAP